MMTPERWQQVKGVLQEALELTAEERSAFLDRACSTDHSLRREVESLLSSSNAVRSSFMKSSPDASLRLSKGTMLGDFEILSLLGAGGMGEVYRARDHRLDRDVAIKALPRFVSFDPERLRRFEQEAKAAAALNHPNILAVFQMGSYEGAPYLVSELLEGETFREQVKQGPIPLKKAVDYAMQIAWGLEAAHEKGIVHRDLKPENLFVTRDGRIKILDFGLAKLTHPESETQLTKQSLDTEPGAVLGTVGYMSPEQVRGLVADHRSDIFAFGAILYEMLSGKRAFNKPTTVETMNAILNEDPPSLWNVVPHLPPALPTVIHRCLEKNPEQRFQYVSDLASVLPASAETQPLAPASVTGAPSKKTPIIGATWKIALPVVVLSIVVATIAGGLVWRTRQARRLTDKDTIVLADFANTTGDPVFDDTLKQGLHVQLEQSPFLNILSEEKVGQQLQLMGRKKDERLTKDLALDLCQRAGGKAIVAGSISSLGTHYVVGLNALSCDTGDVLASRQLEADSQEFTLKALSELASGLRVKVGESLASIQKHDMPLEQATTPSLEALKAYSLGMKIRSEKGDLEAIPFFKQAVERDPDFASAYASLWSCYGNSGQGELSAGYLQKAFELRERASEREKLRISVMFFFANGEMEKALEVAKLWAQEYPRDQHAHIDLGDIYAQLAQYESATTEYVDGIRLDPDDVTAYYRLIEAYALVNRLSEAKATYQEARDHNLDYSYLHGARYDLAFLENDGAEMDRQMAWAMGKPGVEDEFLIRAAAKEVYFGRMGKGRELAQRAIDSARRNKKKEVVAEDEAGLALTEAEYGNSARARRGALAALAEKSSPHVQAIAAIVLTRARDTIRAQAVGENLEKPFPGDIWMIHRYWLPTLRAAIELDRNNPAKAIQLLEGTSTFELQWGGRTIRWLLARTGVFAPTPGQRSWRRVPENS